MRGFGGHTNFLGSFLIEQCSKAMLATLLSITDHIRGHILAVFRQAQSQLNLIRTGSSPTPIHSIVTKKSSIGVNVGC